MILISTNIEELQAISDRITIAMGWTEGNKTEKYGNPLKHPVENKWLLKIDTYVEYLLTEEEKDMEGVYTADWTIDTL